MSQRSREEADEDKGGFSRKSFPNDSLFSFSASYSSFPSFTSEYAH